MGKKGTLLLVSMALALLWASGVALAATINCRASADRCYGTKGSDTINGAAGARTRSTSTRVWTGSSTTVAARSASQGKVWGGSRNG
jgi:hypothetical protein